MDRPSLREGRVVRLWMSTFGGEALYEADLPACCRRNAHASDDPFECVSCGAMWQGATATEPEECGFMEGTHERKGAA